MIKKNFEVLMGKEITYNDLKQAINIDNKVYPKKYRGTIDVCKSWYEHNPDIYIFVKDINKNLIVGYMNTMPVVNNYFKLFEEGKLFDLDIPKEAIIKLNNPGIYKLCLISIAIYKEYQDSEVIKIIINAFIKKIFQLHINKIYFDEFLAEAISGDGENFCKKLGMKQINSFSKNKIMKVQIKSINDYILYLNNLLTDYLCK